MANSKWQRLLCFGPLVELAPTGDAPTLLLNITVKVQPLQPAGADMAPSCGDSLDVRFTSSRALFAPLSVREVECGA